MGPAAATQKGRGVVKNV